MIEHLVLSADAGFVKQLAVTLAGLRHTRALDRLTVHVITDEISAQDRPLLEACAAPHEIRWIAPDTALLAGITMPDWLPLPSLYRLTLGDLLADVGSALYLDADLVLSADLAPLLDIDLEGRVVAAVRDSHFRVFGMREGTPWVGPEVRSGAPYFNAGVLVMDLDRWRAAEYGPRTLELCRTNRFPYGDQDALNIALADKWLELPPRWNVQTLDLVGTIKHFRSVSELEALAQAVDDPAIIHFTKPGKPWTVPCNHPWTQRWFDELDTTPYSGWRPPPPQPQHHRVRDRMRLGGSETRRTASRWVRRVGAPAAATLLKSEDSIAWRTKRISSSVAAASGGAVADGPFRGLRIGALGPELLPSQILGTSLTEVQKVLESSIAGEPPAVALIGVADTTLPAGLAMRLPNTTVHLVEERPEVLRICRSIAAINAVTDRIRIATLPTPVELDQVPTSALWIVSGDHGDRGLMEDIAARAGSSTVLVAGEDHRHPLFSPTVAKLFASTHQIDILPRLGRDPFALPALIGMDDIDRWLAVADHLHHVDHWLHLAPLRPTDQASS